MELGWCIGITIVTPGFLKTKMALRAYEHEVGQLVSCLILYSIFILLSFLIINKILHFKYKLNRHRLLNEVINYYFLHIIRNECSTSFNLNLNQY
jgi:hypothetical protein